jgi:hypothetical protein
MSIVNTKDKQISKVFDIIETGGGGSCLFHVLAYHLSKNHSLKEARKIRKKICKYNPEDLLPFTALAHGEKSMCDDSSYGTTIEIEKAARIYKRPIIVYKENRKTGIASDLVCPSQTRIDNFEAVKKYLNPPFDKVLSRLYCIYLPKKNQNKEPIIIYNIGDYHYRVLKPKLNKKSRKTSSRKSRKSRKESSRKSRKSRKESSRKSRKSRKVSSRKSRKSRKESSRKSRKSRKESSRKSRKSRKVSSRKSRKSRKESSRKSRKSRKESSRKSRKSRKVSSRKSRKITK